ncbi:SAM-dependent methyltransferase [Arthrobacter psychrolactophilus]|uniref:SAM-dependent methyltransferase n=1 Tax=Arthrobacter psychrolactophilus TaxID=92442 RepID=A0A2V5IP86_9MICC|nr:methyltransferase domain-containing protein [Arthrobacter psychrolactophilus]PYI37202.1 SAM-dependent methyltransferase [Arthrobacter psychrolactophilus]
MTHHAHHQDHSHSHAGHVELAETLRLDALLLGAYLDEASEWAAGFIAAPATVVDLGAGSGAGTVALARRFPHADIMALDRSPGMLAEVALAAAQHGIQNRVTTLEADLEQGLPASASADLMWASSFVHELKDPEGALRQMHDTLRPGGVLIVIEMDSLPTFLPASALSGVESRLHEGLAHLGWNAHPDWSEALLGAGFVSVERRLFPSVGSLESSTASLTSRYARAFLSRMREATGSSLSPADQASLEKLLGHGPGSVEQRPDLQLRGSRTGWAALKA